MGGGGDRLLRGTSERCRSPRGELVQIVHLDE